MGAVFALYSAWYFWIPKILGVDYNRSWGKAHFWILFTGVNVTFFPQHFLGLQGMPRRISDYADAFAGWNLVSSLGSIISVIATWLFLYILYIQLVEGKATSRYPWLTPLFYYDMLQTHLIREFNSLEWGLNSPPKPHAFVSLPLQSGLFNFLARKFNFFTFQLFIPIVIGVGLYLAYRFPIHFMLNQLDLLEYYVLFNLLITICSITIIAYLKGNQVKPLQVYLAIFFAFISGLFILYLRAHGQELYAFLTFLLAHSPLLSSKITMADSEFICYHKPGPEGNTGGGGSSSTQTSTSAGTGNNNAGDGGESSKSTGTSGDESKNVKPLERNAQILEELDKGSLIPKYDIQPSILETISKRFPLKNPRDFPESIVFYASTYNLKSMALRELTALNGLSIKNDSDLMSRIAKLEAVSQECSDIMDKYEKHDALKRWERKSISRLNDKKPW